MKEKIAKLTAIAERIVATDADYILLLEEYARLLAEIEPQLGEAAEDSEMRSAIRQLETLHQQVMQRVSSDKEKIRSEIVSLKKKGKAVIIYTDQLPKRISLGTRRKL